MNESEETRKIEMEDGSVLTLTLKQYAEKVNECQKRKGAFFAGGMMPYLQEHMTELRRRWEDGWTPLTVSTEIDLDGL